MQQSRLAEELAGVLHQDPLIRDRVGSRVLQFHQNGKALLPNIVVALDQAELPTGSVTVTCRGRTSAEADRIGAAVIKVLLAPSMPISNHWVRTQDTIGYDSSSKAFKRVISIRPKLDSK